MTLTECAAYIETKKSGQLAAFLLLEGRKGRSAGPIFLRFSPIHLPLSSFLVSKPEPVLDIGLPKALPLRFFRGL